jgi:predicted nucleic acid-binding protein
MKVFLDTTYFIPTLGISLQGIPWDVAFKAQRENEAIVSELTLFELSAKGAKYVNSGLIPPENVVQGVNSLLRDDRFRKVGFCEAPIQRTAIHLRKKLRDYVDCLILSTAAHTCDVLLTEDVELRDMGSEMEKDLTSINPGFSVRTWSEARLGFSS